MTLNITDRQIEAAQKLCSKIKDISTKKRAYLNFVATMFFADVMLNKGCIVSTKRSFLNSHKLYEDFEIADIYCNYHKIYVLFSDGSANIKIPKKHKEYNILPEYYVVVEVDAISNTANLLGSIAPDDINFLNEDGAYFIFPKNSLKPIENIYKIVESSMSAVHPKGKHLDCIKLFDKYVSNSIETNDEKQMIEHIMFCETCKKKLLETLKLKENLTSEKNSCDVLSEINNEKNSTKAEAKDFEKSKDDNLSQIQGAIDLFYNNRDEIGIAKDEFMYKIPSFLKSRKVIILSSFVIFLLFIFMLSALIMPKAANSKKQEVGEEISMQDGVSSFDDSNYDIKLPPIKQNQGYATVTGVSWEVSTSINKENQKKFLQQMGKNIRLNLQNDLLLSSEAIINSKVQFEIIYYKDGTIESIETLKSSGSAAVDDVIRKSVEETLKYARPPKDSFVGRRNSLILNIQF